MRVQTIGRFDDIKIIDAHLCFPLKRFIQIRRKQY